MQNCHVICQLKDTPDSRFIAPTFSENLGLLVSKAWFNFMSFISLLINPAFNKPGFKGNLDVLNQVFGP